MCISRCIGYYSDIEHQGIVRRDNNNEDNDIDMSDNKVNSMEINEH